MLSDNHLLSWWFLPDNALIFTQNQMCMNATKRMVLFLAIILFSFNALRAQEPQAVPETEKIYVIIKNDGTQFIGKIITQDAREVLIETEELGQVFIPRHELKSIREADPALVDTSGTFKPAEVFSTRYFLTTNGLPVEKGDTYILWSLFGPDFQFGISDNLGVGLLTTWIGTPLIGSIKYSIPLKGQWNAGLGLLLGTGSWTWPGLALALPYGVLTYGDRLKNINFSFGYGGVTWKNETSDMFGSTSSSRESEGNFLVSVAGMYKLSNSFSLVFDSFIVPRTGTYQTSEYFSEYNSVTGEYRDGYRTVTKKRYSFALIMPGLRFQTRPNRAFQFGFAGMRLEGETVPLPIPMVQWFILL